MSEGSSLLPQLIATLGATLGAFALGNVIAWPATAIYQIGDEAVISLSTEQESQVVAISMIGSAVVPILAAFSFPTIGKKWTLIALSVPFIGGWVVLLFANSYGMLLAGRILTGFSGGAFVLAAPAYTAEIAESKYRGALGVLMQLMMCFGILFINVNCNTNWKLLSGMCLAFPALCALWMFFMPRSPVFLVSKGDMEEARKSLQFLRGKTARIDGELAMIQEDVRQSKYIGTVGPVQLFTKSQYLKPMGISLVLMSLQQLSGINYVLSYSTLIFKSSGSDIDSCLSAMLVGGIQVAGTFFTTLIIEKFGRKVLLIISDFFICVSMLGVAVFFKMYEDCAECNFVASTNSSLDVFNSSAATMGSVSKATVDSFGWLPLVSLMVFILAFAIGFGPIPWVLNVELMPPEARGIAASICTSFNWIISYLVAKFIPTLGEAINASSCYFIFAGIALLGTVFIIFVVPETKGKSGEEIRRLFSGKSSQDLKKVNTALLS